MRQKNPFDPFAAFPFSQVPPFFPGAAQTPAWPTRWPDPADAVEYAIDAWQRGVLFLDILRQRGNEQKRMAAEPMATVLKFDHEILLSGASLKRPINYSLARILPLQGQRVDASARPLIVVDPRAGQGPGIGGFNDVSEIGEALAQGHPVYFVLFMKEPVPGQTFLDVVEGQVEFVKFVVARHPDAPRPFAFGNCQAGYQTLMGAALRPDLFGPVILAGSPVSYWQGVHGKNPMRYSGGLLGGSWLTALVSDLGGGLFDGAWLILNFDSLNPANWLWGKQYDVYAKVDTEGPRYLGFERWWGDFIQLNGEEMQWLVDELFIGDRLARNQLRASDGTVFDLRSVTSPIVVLTSEGDNISPPAQTLGWILDLYRDVEELQARGRTIVYAIDPHAGHLAIFVSPKVGGKEDEEFVRLIEEIDLLAPGLYELLIEPASAAEIQAGGSLWKSRFERRTFDDIRAHGRNSEQDDRAFETVRRLSERNRASYETFLRPFVRAAVTPAIAKAMFDCHPLRLSYSLFCDDNPFLRPLAALAERVRAARRAVDPDNAFWRMQGDFSARLIEGLDHWRDARDRGVERLFFQIYTSPVLQSGLGLGAHDPVRALPGVTSAERQALQRKARAFVDGIAQGGFDEALIRAVLYVLAAERALEDEALIEFRNLRDELEHTPAAAFRQRVREQHGILRYGRRDAIDALGGFALDAAQRAKLIEVARRVAKAGGGKLTAAQQSRLRILSAALGVSRPAGAGVRKSRSHRRAAS